MIVANVQGINPHDKQIVARDGMILSGSEADGVFEEILRFLRPITKKQGEYITSRQGKTVCFVYHSEKDYIGRNRVVTMMWDDGTDVEDIKKTFDIFDIPFEKFTELNKKRMSLKKALLFVLLLVFICILCVWSWLW